MHDTDRTVSEYGGNMHETDQYEFIEELELDGEMDMGESEETETLAYELLEVSDEAELDQFLGKLISSAGRAVSGFVKSPVGRAVGGFLKSAAKKALPLAGKAVGGYFGGPAGAAIGGKLGTFASGLFEAEGADQEQELEAAKQFVKFAQTAVKNAAAAPPTAPPQQVAKQAVLQAARAHAPNLLGAAGRAGGTAGTEGARRQGRWIRRGRKIILMGV